MIPMIFAMAALMPLLQVHFYIVAPNGTINKNYTNFTGATGFVTATNNSLQGLIGWAMVIIPFLIILVGLGYAMQDLFTAGMVASVVGATIAVLGTGIGTPPLVSNIALYLFIALTLIFGIATLVKGILNPYGN